MMYSLFNSFDYYLLLNSFMLLISIMFSTSVILKLMFNYWMLMNLSQMINNLLSLKLMDLMNDMSNKFSSINIIFKNVFLLIFFINIMGMLPYIFSLSSRLEVSFSIGLTMWVSLIMKSLEMDNSKIFVHLVPPKISTGMSAFLLLIELISNVIRPLTVSFRLSANVTAGHIIFGMIGSKIVFMFCSSHLSVYLGSFFLCFMGYMMFEFCIMLIQASVFVLLFFLYQADYL